MVAKNTHLENTDPSNSTQGNIKNTIKASVIIWFILANINHILRCFIFQKICNGSWIMPAAINVAEKIIATGNPQSIYGLLV